jgi:hypothetical protein
MSNIKRPDKSPPESNNCIVNFLTKHGLAIVFISSLLINLTVLFDYQKSPLSNFLLWDAANYWKWALEIAHGNWLGNIIYHQPPLYPYILSIFISIFGEKLLPIYLFQCLISTATSVILYSIGVKLSTSRLVGLLSGLLYALYGIQVFYATKILSECIATFLIVLAIRLLLSRRFSYTTILSGIFFSLLILIKPHFIIAVPFFASYYFFNTYSHRLMNSIRQTAFFLMPLLLVVLTVTVRNYYVGKEVVLISDNGGINFYIGNNSNTNGTFVPIEGISSDIAYQYTDVLEQAQIQTGKHLTGSEASKFWFNKGLAFITKNPSKFISLEWNKFKDMFSGFERSSMYIMQFEKTHLTHSFQLPFINFYLLTPFFCVGLLVSIRQRLKYFIIFSALIINALTIMIFFYDTRFMMLSMPFFILLSAIGLQAIILTFFKSTKSFTSIITQPVFITFIIGLGLSSLNYVRDKAIPDQNWYMTLTLGDIYYDLDEIDKAIEYYVKASELNKTNCMPSFGLCKSLFKRGLPDVAANLYKSTYATISLDDRKTILRDTELDPLRAYIHSNLHNTTTQ